MKSRTLGNELKNVEIVLAACDSDILSLVASDFCPVLCKRVREEGRAGRKSKNAICMCVKKVMHILVIHTNIAFDATEVCFTSRVYH